MHVGLCELAKEPGVPKRESVSFPRLPVPGAVVPDSATAAGSPAKFDKRAYQRDYMRRYRAGKKA